MDYTIKKIAGIECVFAPMQDTNSVTIEIMVRAGSVYETAETNGISHFLEHMFFKGGKKYPTPKAVAQAVDRFGGEFNAYTSSDYAGYYVKCAPDYTEQAIDVLSDMMINPQFPKEELEREKGVVIQELKMYEDNPRSVVYDRWKTRYTGDNSYGWSTIGTEENIMSFDQEALHAHKDALYTKDNLIIIVSGRIVSPEKVEKQIEELFATLPESMTYKKEDYVKTRPNEKMGSYKKDTQQNHLIISAPGFTGNDEERYATNILTTILGGNMSSRLFQNVREKQGLCYYIGSSHIEKTYDGVFFIRAGIDKDRFDYGVEKINEELDRIANGDITEEEFENAISYTLGSLQMGIETSDSLASFLGNQYLIYNRIETIDQLAERYKALTIDDVKAVCSKLAADNRYMFYVE